MAERARNLRWVHGICMGGPDSLHVGSAMELSCDEFLSFDRTFHKKKQELDRLGLRVCLQRDTLYLPNEYRQDELYKDKTIDSPSEPTDAPDADTTAQGDP